jgi:cytochrome c-type biogenesis protein CcmH/NrfG
MNAALEYTNQMWAGAGFETQQKYAEAVAAYKEALRLMPDDAKALVGLRNAQFGLHMAAGRSAQAAKHFADAVREYEEALKFQPGNAEAAAALKRAKDGKP